MAVPHPKFGTRVLAQRPRPTAAAWYRALFGSIFHKLTDLVYQLLGRGKIFEG
jgi:hypothetical protein